MRREKYCVEGLDSETMEKARARMDSLAKPIGSLGELEETAIRLAGITKSLQPELSKKAMVVFAADNGIWEEGISPIPQEVTLTQTVNMTKNLAGINVLSRYAGADLYLVDVGIRTDEPIDGVIDRKVMKGTRDMAKGPAMSREEALKALEVGRSFAKELAAQGYGLIAPGEMGICNTSSSSAVLSCLAGVPVEQVTGKGAGLDDALYRKKINAIQQAIEKNAPDAGDPLDVLAKVGGLDIAAMAGFYLGAAESRIPAVVDGFIAIVAALVAYRLAPNIREYLFGSHHSEERGYGVAREILGLYPLLNLHLRLGEGTGCPLAFFVIEAAAKIMKEMGTLEQGDIDPEVLVDIRE